MYKLPLSAYIQGYADDTSLLYKAETKNEFEEKFERDFDLLTLWFKKHRLHLNIKKCKFIAYGYKTPLWADSINLSLGIEKLERVLAMKYLGIIMDEKLTWREQSLYIQGKMRGINYIFYHLKKYINQNHLKKLYINLYMNQI